MKKLASKRPTSPPRMQLDNWTLVAPSSECGMLNRTDMPLSPPEHACAPLASWISFQQSLVGRVLTLNWLTFQYQALDSSDPTQFVLLT